MPYIDPLDTLRSFPPFDGLDERTLQELAGDVRSVQLVAGDLLVEAGEVADELYVVLDGELEVLAPEQDGRAPVLTRLGPGAVVGEIAVLAGGRRSASLRAVGPVRAVGIAGRAFSELLRRAPQLGADLARTASQRLRATRLAGQLQRLFPETETAALVELADTVGFVALGAGEALYREGDPSDAAYVVVSGRVRVLTRDDEGDWAEPIAEIGAGELVGELALLDDAPRTATVVAARHTELARLSRQDFEELVSSRPPAMLAVVRTIVARSRDARDTYRRARSDHTAIGLVPLGPTVDLARVADELTKRFALHGPATTVASADVDAALGVAGISRTEAGGPDELRLARWMEESEAANEFLVLQADDGPSPWSRHCIDRVDHVVLVADATASPEPTALEVQLLAARTLPHQHVSLVLLQPIGAERPRGTTAWLERRDVDEHHHARLDLPDDLDRVARHLAGRAVWLVLGGGGAKGFAHLGVVKAMEELDLPIDGVAGASVGAALGAMLALQTPREDRVRLTTELFARKLDYTLPVSGMIAGRRITRAIESVTGDRAIEDTWLPFVCTSTNLTRSRPVVHRRGELRRAVRASLSIPGVLPPVTMGDDLLVDGGVMNNLPVDVIRRRHPTATIIASDAAPPLGPRARGDHGLSVRGGRVLARRVIPGMRAPRVPRLAATLMRSLLVAAAEKRDRQVEAGLADLHLQFELRGVGLLAFDVVAPVVDRGYDESIGRLRAFAATVLRDASER